MFSWNVNQSWQTVKTRCLDLWNLQNKKRCHDSISSAHLHKCIYSFVYFHDTLHAQTPYHCYTYYYRPISTSLLLWLITCQPSYFLRIFNLVPYLGWVDLGTIFNVFWGGFFFVCLIWIRMCCVTYSVTIFVCLSAWHIWL